MKALLIAFLLTCAYPAAARDSFAAPSPADLRPDRVRSDLQPPTNPEHRFIYESLRRRGVLERLSRFLSPFRLPREVTMRVGDCNGEVNAYYEDGEIFVCYEYLDFIVRNAPEGWSDDGIARRDAVTGPTVDVFLHEMGHAVFDLLRIPVLGREEDAADLFSAYIQLQASPEEARSLITGVAFLGRHEMRAAMKTELQLKHFADEHGFAGQRYFNVLCIAYGFDRVLFADAVTVWGLPPERAEACSAEYAQLDRAFRALIMPYIDRDLLAQVRAKKWLMFGPGDGHSPGASVGPPPHHRGNPAEASRALGKRPEQDR